MRGYRQKCEERSSALRRVLGVILLIFLMPLVGIYLLACEDPKLQPLGGVLFALGAGLWFAVLGLF